MKKKKRGEEKSPFGDLHLPFKHFNCPILLSIPEFIYFSIGLPMSYFFCCHFGKYKLFSLKLGAL